ncbi:MAG TPA: MBL fold metallo-hydrolase [Candidatus Eisenbacteria bacterium]|nr:MBL fold metallo-hydrolase [Candidatus Eisenbacteria bacterium]
MPRMDFRRLGACALLVVLATDCAGVSHLHQGPSSMYAPEPEPNAITFWGHACAYIDVGGVGIVTDPVFTDHYATIRRRLIPAPPASAYDQTDVVLISHAHHDHLNAATLRQFPADAVILAPAPAARYLRQRGIRARVMAPGDEFAIPGGSIVAVAAHHPGGRHSLRARADGRAVGYVIRTPYATIYYSGDTEYFDGFADVGARFDPDIALMNINAHLHSPEAIVAVAELGMPVVIPIHHGAYNGKNFRHGPRWLGELEHALGPTVVPIDVGESYLLPAVARAAEAAR